MPHSVNRASTMRRLRTPGALCVLLAAMCLVPPARSLGDPVSVRYTEGLVHGFLALRALDGTTLAHGDLNQTARDGRVTSQLLFRFKDGSVHEETAVYSQRGTFRLLSHHLVQKGRSFPRPLDMRIDPPKGQVTVRYTDDEGERQVESAQLDLPSDLANGLVLTLLKNLPPGVPPSSVAYVAATPKPRLVKLAIAEAGEESFSTGGGARKATRYVVKVELGGIAGLVAPILGKKPPDSHVWIFRGEAPTFVKSEQTLYSGGPVWRIELVSPVWPPQGHSSEAKPR